MSRSYSGIDRRRYQRLKINVSAWFRVLEPLYIKNVFGEREIEATTLDISEAGMGLLTEHNIPASTVILIKLMLFKTDAKGAVSFSDPIEILGVVRSNILLDTDEHRLGIAFKQVRLREQSDINGYLEFAAK